MIDAIGGEVHFIDHAAPVWAALPSDVRGRFIVDNRLVPHAKSRGIDPDAMDLVKMRQTEQQGPQSAWRPTLVASIGDIKLGRRLGLGPFVFLEHGAGQGYDGNNASMASYAGGPDRQDNELFLVPNEYSAQRWRRSYPGARVEIVGCPKLDVLPRREPGPKPVVAISFHGPWPNGVPYGGNALGEFAPQIPILAKRFDIIGHAHPGLDWGGRMERLFAKSGVPFVADFEAVCRQADVYVCDNSSTIFEFASTGRPVVLMNARHWSRKGGPGLRFWDAAHVGINVDRPEDLVAGVERALEDAPERQRDREDALSFVYQPRTNGATYAANAIADWLASRQAVAA